MTVAIYNETFVGVGEFKIRRLSDGFIYNLPIPSTFNLQENKTQQIQLTKNTQGQTVRSSSYIKGSQPLLTVDYTYMQPELIAFRVGNSFEQNIYPIDIDMTLDITQTSYSGASPGYIGYGMPADQANSGGAIRQLSGLSIQLTRVPYATNLTNLTRSFSQGPNAAINVSPDLVGQVASFVFPHTVTGIALGDEIIGAHQIIAQLIDTENTVWIFTANNVTVSAEGSAFSPDAETLQIPFFVNNPPGACRSWNLTCTYQQVGCTY